MPTKQNELKSHLCNYSPAKMKHHTKICNLEELKPAHEPKKLALQKVIKTNVLVMIVSKMYIFELKLSRQKIKNKQNPKKLCSIVAVVIKTF